MMQEQHFRCLESMYQAAPINEFYRPVMEVLAGKATIEIELSEKFHHAAGATHGSVYFKMLDDAAFFAANSLETTFFVLTASFTTYLTRPVVSGKFKSVGTIVKSNEFQFIAESRVYDSADNEVGSGSGVFVISTLPLKGAAGYISK